MSVFTVRENALLLDYLRRILPDTNRTRLKQLLKYKSVSINGQVSTRFDHPLVVGDQISVVTVKKSHEKVSPQFDVRIIYEDDALIVIEKPAGLLTIATEKIRGKTAFQSVNEYLNQVED